MSRDVVFDKFTSWYTIDIAPSEPFATNFVIDSEEDDRLRLTPEECPISTRLSGPQKPPSDQSTSQPSPKVDKGTAKCLHLKTDNLMEMNRLTHSIVSMVDSMYP